MLNHIVYWMRNQYGCAPDAARIHINIIIYSYIYVCCIAAEASQSNVATAFLAATTTYPTRDFSHSETFKQTYTQSMCCFMPNFALQSVDMCGAMTLPKKGYKTFIYRIQHHAYNNVHRHYGTEFNHRSRPYRYCNGGLFAVAQITAKKTNIIFTYTIESSADAFEGIEKK